MKKIQTMYQVRPRLGEISLKKQQPKHTVYQQNPSLVRF